MDTLVSLGVGAAYLYSLYVTASIWLGNGKFGMGDLYYEVAAFLITFILLGKYLEAVAKGRTSEAIKKLIGLQAKTAQVIRDGKEIEIRIEEVQVGDIVVVKPGGKIPVDGTVTDGYSSVDESMVTAIDLSAYAMSKIRQNLFWAFIYNTLGIPIAAGVLYPFTGFLLNPVIAGAAMAFSSVSVVTNSLLMRNFRPRLGAGR